MGKTYLDMNGLAAYIGLSVKTLRNWKTSNPEKLPPFINVACGGKHDRLRFDVEAVDAWILAMNKHDTGLATR